MLLFLLSCAPQEFYTFSSCDLWDLDGDGHPAAYQLVYESESLPTGEEIERTLLSCDGTDLFGSVDEDCDDASSSVHPSAPELCDGLDNDCDGEPEADVDGDGHYGTGTCADDCDDTDAAILPGAEEACNFQDDDCDALIDEDHDVDDDGWTSCAGDCDEGSAAVHPGADEGCDGLDTDCDGTLGDDELDDDGDGLSDCDGDCDDGDAAVYPGAEEVCDGLDTDCSGDGLDLSERDGDGDGARACDDCDDGDPDQAPGLDEWCDALDNDCDGAIDEDFDADGDGTTTCDGDCDDADASVHPGADEACDGLDTDCSGLPSFDELDLDGDGVSTCDGDCDDGRAEAFPGAVETCNGLDDDCDGAPGSDEEDADGDGASACEGDCDDGNPVSNLFDLDADGATSCDGDCDDLDATQNLLDADADGWSSCDGDCDDLDAALSPGSSEICDEVDQDCDGGIDEDFADDNADDIADCIELCDGVDNDGDGSADEGFSDGTSTATWVSASAGSSSGDGTWLDPLDTIGAAVDRSLTEGACAVRVLPGTYTEALVLPARALEIVGDQGAELTILEGSSTSPILTVEPGATSELVVEGFTFRDGALTDASGSGEDDLRQGAAVQLEQASPTLRCNRFEDNSAADRGGALWIDGGSPTVEDSYFAGNVASGISGEDGGGAIYLASGTLTLSGSTFYGNYAAGNGGAVFVAPDAELLLTSTRFLQNQSDAIGGALALDDAATTVSGVLLQGNVASVGGALYLDVGEPQHSIEHLTVLENEATSAFGGGVVFQDDGGAITSSILAWPEAGGVVGWCTDDVGVPPAATVTWSLVYDPAGGVLDSNYGGELALGQAEGNVEDDPLFSSFDADGALLDDDLSLATASPAVDAAASGSTDADGSAADMGGLGGPTPYEPVPSCIGSVP